MPKSFMFVMFLVVFGVCQAFVHHLIQKLENFPL
jgi:hypothetical protein